MTVQLPNTETHDVSLSALPTDPAGLEDVCRLVEDTQRLLDTMLTLVRLTDDASAAEMSIPLCHSHAAAIEKFAQLEVEGLEQRVEEMNRRVAVTELHLQELERRLAETERTLDESDARIDDAI